MFVVGRLDAHVQGHLRRYGEAGVELDLGDDDLREALADALQILEEIAVRTDVDDHHFEGGVLLGQQQREPFFDEVVIFGEHGDHHRQRRLLLQTGTQAAALVSRHGSVVQHVIVHLYSQHDEQHAAQRDAFPAVVEQYRIEE